MSNEIKGFIVRLSDTEHIIVPEDLDIDINKYEKKDFIGVTILFIDGSFYHFYISERVGCCEKHGFKINSNTFIGDYYSQHRHKMIWDNLVVIKELLSYIGKEVDNVNYHDVEKEYSDDRELVFTINLHGIEPLRLALYNMEQTCYDTHEIYIEYPGCTRDPLENCI